MTIKSLKFPVACALLFFPTYLLARPIYAASSGQAAWLLIAGVLVIFMTMPGIALFYGGLVRRKNVLSVMAQCYVVTAIISLLWMIIGYTLTFGSTAPIIGSWANVFLNGLGLTAAHPAFEKLLFVFFQLGFAVIAVAIILGGFAERMKFVAVLAFIILWEIFVYYPIAHWVWGGGWLERLGVLDFAGGTVVHVNAGIAGLVAAIMVGPRKEFSKRLDIKPHNLNLAAIGAAILWIGWFGFNAGSSLDFSRSASAAIVTQTAASSALLTWMCLDWIFRGKPSIASMLLGAVTGLVAITPAAGYVGLLGAICIGIIASGACFLLIRIKYIFGYDDSLDAFGVHGIGGIVGSLLTGIFFAKSLGGTGHDGFSIGRQIIAQIIDIATVIIWSGGISFIILFFIKRSIKLRVKPESEEMGLDLASHGAYTFKNFRERHKKP